MSNLSNYSWVSSSPGRRRDGAAELRYLLAERRRYPVQLPLAKARSRRAALRSRRVLAPIARRAVVPAQRSRGLPFSVCPDTRAFAIGEALGAVVHNAHGQMREKLAILELPAVRVLDEQRWVSQGRCNLERTPNQAIGCFQISAAASRARSRVLCARRAGPNRIDLSDTLPVPPVLRHG